MAVFSLLHINGYQIQKSETLTKHPKSQNVLEEEKGDSKSFQGCKMFQGSNLGFKVSRLQKVSKSQKSIHSFLTFSATTFKFDRVSKYQKVKSIKKKYKTQI